MRTLLLAALLTGLLPRLHAQTELLDPTRGIPPAANTHQPLPEQYLWTANDVTAQRPDHNKFPWNRPQLRTEPHRFRTTFDVVVPPKSATLYVAGPRSARVWINGKLAASFNSDIDAPINFHVFHADVAPLLRAGRNVVAIEAVRGRGVVAASGSQATQQIAYGEVLAAKIVPGSFGVEVPALVLTTPAWKSVAGGGSADDPRDAWTRIGFDDKRWPAAATLGPIEGDPDLRQWNADAGMYEWPGYMGMSPLLRTLELAPKVITHVFAGSSDVSLPGDGASQKKPFVIRHFVSGTDSDAPAVLLDFGREITGRLLVRSTSSCESTMSVAYGESELEALATGLTPGQRGGNYLGTNLLTIPPGGIARGPKSAFRYAHLRFLKGCSTLSFAFVGAEVIYYPVEYRGSFESSDPLLNRIWETGAYTAHLAMQDGIWDAPKRDRGLWVGDLDISGRVISTAFGDTAALEESLDRLARQTRPGEHVNGIPSYSALWITTLADLYRRAADIAFLRSQQTHLHQILATIDASFSTGGEFTNPKHQWLFVDWAPGLYAYTPDAVTGTELQFLRAYQAAGPLLAALNDPAAGSLKVVHLPGSFGDSLQVRALAVLCGEHVSLADIKQDAPSDPVISPYGSAYLLDALAANGRAQQALDWIRTYWGGMLAEGATSFWEAYDLRWQKADPHLGLQADGTSGFFVSLAHGWSAHPTTWLSENVLGIRPSSPGYATAIIEPHLLGLAWARGQVPTPHGPIAVAIDKEKGLTVDVPPGVSAQVKWNGKAPQTLGAGHHTLP